MVRSAADPLDAMLGDLEAIGRAPDTGGYRRFAWTAQDAQLREWFAGEAVRRGLDLTEDRAGNQWAFAGDPQDSRGAIVIGSHLDSVPDGGAFDGPLGVASAFAALDRLRENGVAIDRPIAIVNFGDEEGARFGVACAGSRLLTGAMTAERALGLMDADGVTMADALTRAGRADLAGTSSAASRIGRDEEMLARIGCYVELHIEQGRAMADLPREVSYGGAVGVGSAIWPHGRWRIDLPGQANHAGTTALGDRRDAMLALADVVLVARQRAERAGALATIGRVVVHPNGVNAIPSLVTAWLDVRAADEAAVAGCVGQIRDRVVSQHDGELAQESWTGTTAFDPGLVAEVRRMLGDDVPVLPTGAGHDAGILAAEGIPAAMLFVRNPTGVSHSPAEFAEPDDCAAGVQALTHVVAELAGAGR